MYEHAVVLSSVRFYFWGRSSYTNFSARENSRNENSEFLKKVIIYYPLFYFRWKRDLPNFEIKPEKQESNTNFATYEMFARTLNFLRTRIPWNKFPSDRISYFNVIFYYIGTMGQISIGNPTLPGQWISRNKSIFSYWISLPGSFSEITDKNNHVSKF